MLGTASGQISAAEDEVVDRNVLYKRSSSAYRSILTTYFNYEVSAQNSDSYLVEARYTVRTVLTTSVKMGLLYSQL